MPEKIAFICTGNSARSQIAEGLCKHFARLLNKNVEVYSAGSNPSGYIHPLAINVMKEIGIDMSNQYSKHIDEIPISEMNYIIILCEDAEKNCPIVKGAKILNWKLDDPAKYKDKQILEAFIKTRTILEKKIKKLLMSI